ncbi:hypothetical protein M0Q97_09365 [Candidatus Dojkabacteria bacterium]|nr:hypothetical protein [Candidatus Dojkabacteria bacterium]
MEEHDKLQTLTPNVLYCAKLGFRLELQTLTPNRNYWDKIQSLTHNQYPTWLEHDKLQTLTPNHFIAAQYLPLR